MKGQERVGKEEEVTADEEKEEREREGQMRRKERGREREGGREVGVKMKEGKEGRKRVTTGTDNEWVCWGNELHTTMHWVVHHRTQSIFHTHPVSQNYSYSINTELTPIYYFSGLV